MKEILNKLNELISICENRVRKTEEDAAKNAGYGSKLEAKEKELNDLQADLKTQEQFLSKKKSKYLSERELEKAKKEFEDLKSVFKKQSDERKTELDKKEIELSNGLKALEEKKAKIIKEAEVLASDRKKYKKEILDAIHKEMSGKKG